MRLAKGSTAAIAVTTLCLAAPSASPAVPTKPDTGKLTARLAELTAPAARSASRAEQAARVSLPARGAGSLLRAGDDLIVSARVSAPSSRALRALRRAGADVVHVSDQYRTVTLAARPGELARIASVPKVEVVMEELTPLLAGSGASDGTGSRAPCTGAATSEGDTQLKAKTARSKFGVSGAGVEVGILSDSFDKNAGAVTHQANDVASGDLPGAANPCGRLTPVDKLDDSQATGSDEGRAMAQLVHDLAPDAALSFATAFTSLNAFADNVRDLQAAGADVIVDDVFYFAEPFFQPGPVDVAVDDVTAAGSTYFSSAGNSNVIVGGNNVSSWETPVYRNTACPAPIPGSACLDFDPGAGTDNGFAITVPSGRGFLLDMQYAQPWFGVTADIDVYVVDSGNVIRAASESCNFLAPGCTSETQQPVEVLSYVNSTASTQTVRVVIRKFAGAANPRLKFILAQAGGITGTEYPSSAGGDIVGPTIFSHNGGTNAMSTAAVPYNNSATVETFSSRGPVTHYFGPVVGTTPAAPLGSPAVLAKPDVAATDGAQTTFFGSFTGGVWRFFGTSAAAPHAAAVAALQLDGFPSATVNQVKTAQKSTAAPVGTFGADAVGAGLVNAQAAVANLLPAASIGDVTKTEGNAGTKIFKFPVTLSKPSAVLTKVKWETANGSATAGSDYVAASGSANFPAGVTTKNVSVTVNGDTAPEANETFSVQLKKTTRLKLGDGTAVGTITNDD